MDVFKIVLVVFTAIALVLIVMFSGLSNIARFKAGFRDTDLFPYPYGSLSEQETVLLEPAHDIYGVWVFAYVCQVAVVGYAVSLIFRPSAPNILNKKFYGCYLLALLCNIAWMFVWTNHVYALGLVLYIVQALCLNASLYFVCTSCSNYLESFPNIEQTLAVTDLWLIRSLVINGISFFTGWISVTGLIDFTVVLQRDLDASQSTAAKISLSLLLIGILLWSVTENFICEKHTRFMFAEYFAVVVAVAGIIANKSWNHQHDVIRAYSLAVFIITVMLLLFRLGFILSKEIKRGALFLGHHEPGENVKLV